MWDVLHFRDHSIYFVMSDRDSDNMIRVDISAHPTSRKFITFNSSKKIDR